MDRNFGECGHVRAWQRRDPAGAGHSKSRPSAGWMANHPFGTSMRPDPVPPHGAEPRRGPKDGYVKELRRPAPAEAGRQL